MRALLAAALALSLAPSVSAQGLPEALWYDGPNTVAPGDGRMRLVFDGAGQAAALTPNQWWDYSGSYRRNMAALSLRMPVAQAIPRARAAAFAEVAATHPTLRVQAIDVERLDGPRLAPRF